MTNRYRRGCVLAVIVLLIVAVALCAVGWMNNQVLAQEATCTAVALVGGTAIPYANVRDLPDGTPIARIFPGDTPAPADTSRRVSGNTWWHVCNVNGWVRGDVVNVATVTRTPVVIIRTTAPTKVGTPAGGVVWLCWQGVCQECKMPCTVEVRERP